MRQLAEWYYAQGDHRVFYVDYINSYVSKSGDSTRGHWSTFGYVNIALAINHALNKVIEEYMNTNALKAWVTILRVTEQQGMTKQGLAAISDTLIANKLLFDKIKELKLPYDQLIDEHNYNWIHVSYEPHNRRQIIHIK